MGFHVWFIGLALAAVLLSSAGGWWAETRNPPRRDASNICFICLAVSLAWFAAAVVSLLAEAGTAGGSGL